MPFWNRNPSVDDLYKQEEESWLRAFDFHRQKLRADLKIGDPEYSIQSLQEHLPPMRQVRREIWEPRLNDTILASRRYGIVSVWDQDLNDFQAMLEYLETKV